MNVTTIVILVCAAALVAFAITRTAGKFSKKNKGASCCGTAEVVSAKPVEDMDESHYPYRYKLSVGGMSCSNCARNVENAINDLGEVWCRVNLGKSEADVLAKKEMAEEDFRNALSAVDYTVEGCTACQGA